MEAQLVLRDQNTSPSDEVLEKALGKRFSIYQELIQTMTSEEYGLSAEWRYYKDGKSWLCKVTFKKKTVFWLSVWDKYFQVGFYFTEKNRTGIEELSISDDLKIDFSQEKPTGKLIPLIIRVTKKKRNRSRLLIRGAVKLVLVK